MFLNPSFVEGSLEDAVESLAKLASYCRTSPRSGTEKQAIAASDTLGAVGRLLSHPGAAAAAGGGVGALAGGIGAAWGNRGKPREERRSILSTALTGGLAGAAVGGGASLASKGLGGLKSPEHAPIPDNPIDVAGTGMKLSPRVMTEMPGAHKQLQELAEPGRWERLAAPVKGAVNFALDEFPVSSVALPTMAAADIATHSQARFGGRMLGDKNWLHAPGVAADYTGRFLKMAPKAGRTMGAVRDVGSVLKKFGDKLRKADYGIGMIDPRNSTDHTHLADGVTSVIDKGEKANTNIGAPQRKILEWMKNDPEGRKQLEALGRTRKPEDFTKAVTTKVESTAKPKKTWLHEERFTPGEVDPVRVKKQVFVPNKPQMTDVTADATLGSETIKELKEIGARAQLGMPGMAENKTPTTTGTPRVRRGITGKTSNVPGGLKSLPRAVPRALAYAGVPVAEFLAKSWSEQQGREGAQKSLIEKMRERGLIQQGG